MASSNTYNRDHKNTDKPARSGSMTPNSTQTLTLNVAEHAKGPGILRVQADAAGQGRNRLLIPAHQPVRLTTLGQDPGVLRVQLDGAGQVRNRLLVAGQGLV